MTGKTPINDPRLTPTMEMVRNGRTQLFREKNPADRTFISKDNADVILEHENKAMYAKLIDGVWYWLNGCQECNGKPRNIVHSYVECEEHDRCMSCGAKYNEVKKRYGSVSGWVCGTCKEEERKEKKRLAFERLGGKKPDCEYTDSIICPKCGTSNGSDEYEETTMECCVCNTEFNVDVGYTRYYSTELIK